jgi:hypothetical protein
MVKTGRILKQRHVPIADKLLDVSSAFNPDPENK